MLPVIRDHPYPPEIFGPAKDRQTALDRNRKKLKSSAEADERILRRRTSTRFTGELINTYGYGLEEGCKSFKAVNYYTNGGNYHSP